MGTRLDEPDEPDESNKSDDCPRRSRRRFVVGAVKAGTAAGAALWVTPKLSSVALAQETAGSPAPSTSTTEPPEVEPEVEEVPEVSRAGVARDVPTEPTEVGGVGVLPVTGADLQTLAVAGGGAVAAGEALLLARRYFPEPQLAISAAGATNASPAQSAGEVAALPSSDAELLEGGGVSAED